MDDKEKTREIQPHFHKKCSKPFSYLYTCTMLDIYPTDLSTL